MADFPSNIWIRDPVIDGRPLKGGALNRAVTLLKQARDEITAVETKLGTDPAGSMPTLAARLAVRHSPSGIPRGRVFMLYGSTKGWWDRPQRNVQIGISSVQSTANPTISFTVSYTVAPDNVLVGYIAHDTDLLLGVVQLDAGSITTTGFRVNAKNFSSVDVWGTPSGTARYYVAWMAMGGS